MSEGDCKTDEHLAALTALANSIAPEKHDAWAALAIDGHPVGTDRAVVLEALDAAQDALAFSQALWDLFADQVLHSDGAEPDYAKMENIVDALNGELAAAVLFINSLNIDAEKLLMKNADLLDRYKHEDLDGGGSGSAAGAAAVPHVIIEGNRRLAKRIKNTKVIFSAQSRTRVLTRTQLHE